MSAATEVVDFEKFKVADLKRMLKERGLSIAGNKSDLIQRLQAFEMSSENGTEDVVADEDELLKGGDDEDVEEEEEDEEETTEVKSPEEEAEEVPAPDTEEDQTPPKKIKLTTPAELPSTTISKPEPTNEEEGEGKREPAEKTGGMLVKRAERFGIQSADAKKLARAKRFGIPVTSPTSKASSNGKGSIGATTLSSSEELEKLKKRAERFGTIVSAPLSKVAQDAKIQKRKERFGITMSATSTTTNPGDMDEKKRRRLERFGMAK